MFISPKNYMAICHECDLTVAIDILQEGEKATCPRCGYTITRSHHNVLTRMLAFSFTALIALIFSNLFSFLTLGAQGSERELTLLQSIFTLWVQGEWILSLIIFWIVLVLPVVFSVVLVLLLFTIKQDKVSKQTILLLRAVKLFRFWNMSEIYFLGIFISIIKIISLADIVFGPSFWFFTVFSISQIIVILHLDSFQLANHIRAIAQHQTTPNSNTAAILDQTYETELNCHHCEMLQSAGNHHCEFCNLKVHQRKANSLQRTWIFLITSILLYVPANIMPIMVTSTLGTAESSTIIGGVLLLWEHGSYPIATIIFIASIAVPFAKFVILFGLVISEQFKLFNQPRKKVRAYRATEFIGRWSMVDVFVVAFLAGLVQMGNLMTIYPGPAVLAFAGMVVTTMLAASSLDPKLFWDNYEQ